jgi:hypothetical protein
MYSLLVAIALSQAAVSGDYEPAVWSTNKKVLDCSPRTVTPSGTLTLKLGKGHGDELAVRRVADNAWFLLVVGMPSEGEPQLMKTDEFAVAKQVLVQGDFVSRSTPNRPEKIFSRQGKYEIYVSDVLESEVGGYRCSFVVKAHEP